MLITSHPSSYKLMMAKGLEPLMTEYESIVFPIKLCHLIFVQD